MRLQELASGGFQRKLLSPALKRTAAEQIERSFRTATDPDGRAWPRLRSRTGTPLVDSGALRGSFVVETTSAGLRVRSRVRYARMHQNGASVRRRRSRRRKAASPRAVAIPARPMVPTSRWGSQWKLEIRTTAKRAMRFFFRR